MAKTDTPQGAAKSTSFPPWSPWLAVVALVGIYVAASFAGASIAQLYAYLTKGGLTQGNIWLYNPTVYEFIFVLGVEAVTVALLLGFIKRYKVTLRPFGWVRPRLKDIGIALLGVVPYIIGYAALLVIAMNLFPSLDVEQEQQLGFEPSENAVALLLTFISLVILPPLVEELVMRGFLFTSLLKRFRFAGAAIITSIIFAAAHLQFGSGAPLLWVAAIDTFILSIILCYMRYKTGSLWPGIFLHALKNGVAFLSIFVFHLT